MALFNASRLKELEATHARRQTIMIVDDEDANLRVMSSILRPSFNVLQAHDGQEALAAIQALDSPERLTCIISDQRMPNLSGIELFEQTNSLIPDTPRILVTGFIDVDAIIDSINKAQLYRFIVKPYNVNDFVLTVQRAVESFELKKELADHHRDLAEKVRLRTQELAEKNLELEQAYKTLKEVSLTDPLTGLRNRRFLVAQLDADIALCLRRYEKWQMQPADPPPVDADLVFLMVDIDHFKAVNDTYGHAAGDSLLQQMRGRLEQVLRESDYVIRWGGEEFLIVSRSTNRADAKAVAERIRAAICGDDFELPDGSRLAKTCSVGFACYPFLPTHPFLLSWSQVVELSDRALYLAKHGGRNAWVGLYATETTQADGLVERLAQSTERESLLAGDLRIVSNAELAIERPLDDSGPAIELEEKVQP